MSRIFTEGFEDNHLTEQPWLVGGSTSGIFLTGWARPNSGIRALEFQWNANPAGVIQTPAFSASEIWLRVAVRLNVNCSYNLNYINFRSASGNEVNIQFAAYSEVKVLVNNTVCITSIRKLPIETWHLVELHYKAGTVFGQLDLKIEGIGEGSYTGNTLTLGGTAITAVRFNGAGGANGNWAIDDIAINDNGGSVDNSWCHDARIISLLPNGAGSANQWLRDDTNTATTDNYTRVNGSTSGYVYSQTVGNKDLYNVANPAGILPADGILRVWPGAIASEAVADADALQLGILTGGNEYWSADRVLTTLDTAYQGNVYTQNPNTSAAWTQAEINDLQVGIKVGSDGS
jgi:hypothetical protein